VATQQVRIRFFRVQPRRRKDEPWTDGLFPIKELRAEVEHRDKSDDDRYVGIDRDLFIAKVVSFSNGDPAPFSLYRVRRDRLPNEERHGKILQLELDDESNLAEGTHLIFFERNIVGVCSFKETPGRAAICSYIESILPHRSVRLEPILRREAMALLEQADRLLSATVKVVASNADALAQVAPSLTEASHALTQATNSRAVTFTLFAGETDQQQSGFKQSILRTFGRIADDDNAEVETLKVEYISEETGKDVVDLLGDDLSVYADVDFDGARRFVPSTIAHDAIREAFDEGRDDIYAAIELLD
jgi:hypothetical protein